MIRKHFRLRRRLVAGLVFGLIAVPAASATPNFGGHPYIPAKKIEVVGEHGKISAQLSRDQVEAMRWQAAADYYSRQAKSQTPVTTEHSFGASTISAKNIEVVGEHGKVSAQLSRDQVEAMRWQAAADYYLSKAQTPVTTEHSFGASKQRPVEPTVVSVSPRDGFDWADAGIGASVAFASLLGLSMLLIVSRRSRKGLDGSGIATA